MKKRRRTGDEAINAGDGSRFSVIADALWTAQDRARSGLRQTLESLSWTVRRWLLWPLQDRAETAGAPARALGVAVLVLAAAGAGVGALIWAAPDRGERQATVAAVSTAAAPKAAAAAEPKPAAPALQGAAPVFESGGGDATGPGGVEPAASAGKGGASASASASASQPDDPAAAISSEPDSSSPAADGAATSSAEDRKERGPVAGPAAVAVARQFATAFVSYEIGGAEEAAVRRAFEATTTPELSQALLNRPPSLPASVEVPKAKVLNVVPAPSHGRVFPISVSLLRVGTTSELRLEMEKLEGKRWRVTNVLG